MLKGISKEISKEITKEGNMLIIKVILLKISIQYCIRILA
jgi:hypothetical protein